MGVDDAVRLLIHDVVGGPPDGASYEALVERLGRWPLLVDLAGGALRARIGRGASPQAAQPRVLDEAYFRRGVAAFDAANTDERDRAVAASVQVSLDVLGGDEVTRWAELAVFPGDTPIPLATVGQLWGTEAFETDEVADRLADVCRSCSSIFATTRSRCTTS